MFVRVGEATDIVSKEMYDFEDKGGRRLALRPELTAVGRAGLRRAPARHAVEGVVRRAQLPLRDGRRRAATASSTRSTSRSSAPRTRRRRRGDRPRLALLRAARAAPGRAQLNSLGDARRPGPLRRRARRPTSTRHLGRPERPRARRRSSSNPLRVLDSKRPQDAPIIERRPTIADASLREPPPRTSTAVQAGLDGARHPVRDRRPGSSAASTTTAARRSSTAAARSTRPRTPSAAAAATTASSRSSAGRRRPASASRSASSASCWPATPRACSARRPTTRRRVRRRHHRRHSRRCRSPTSCARAGVARRPRLRRPQHEEPDEGGRPQRRRVRA